MNSPVDLLDTEDSPFTLRPLPPVLRHGLAAVATFGFLSFFSSVSLLIFLSWKMVKWQMKPAKTTVPVPERRPLSPISDFDGFLVPDNHFCPPKEPEYETVEHSFWERLKKDPPNQFLVLILNLLLADIQQAMAFLLNVTWLTRDAVVIETSTCWAQGWFVSTGDLASSMFITAIAGHTYLGIVRNYRLPTWVFYWTIGILWTFVYATGLLGVIITNNGAKTGGLYVRAGAWCWINSSYQDLRLTLHYLWIFICFALTTMIYTVIFLHLQSIARRAGKVPEHIARSASRASSRAASRAGSYRESEPSSPTSISSDWTLKQLPPIPKYARQQTFLLYPAIYVLCTAPLAAGRIASMAGNNVTLGYFCFAGAMIACNGWLDVVLYATTRRSIVFSGERPPSQDTGLETFAFMRTPATRRFGNVVFVSGGVDPERKAERWSKWSDKVIRGGGRLGKFRPEKNESSDSLKGFGMGKGAVMGMAIQCETTTSVVIEVEHPSQVATRKPSVTSSISSSNRARR